MQNFPCSPALCTCSAGSANPCLSQEGRSPPGRGVEGDSSSREMPNRATHGASWCEFTNKLWHIKKDLSRGCSFDISKPIKQKWLLKCKIQTYFVPWLLQAGSKLRRRREYSLYWFLIPELAIFPICFGIMCHKVKRTDVLLVQEWLIYWVSVLACSMIRFFSDCVLGTCTG